jgi:hypothetical protein
MNLPGLFCHSNWLDGPGVLCLQQTFWRDCSTMHSSSICCPQNVPQAIPATSSFPNWSHLSFVHILPAWQNVGPPLPVVHACCLQVNCKITASLLSQYACRTTASCQTMRSLQGLQVFTGVHNATSCSQVFTTSVHNATYMSSKTVATIQTAGPVCT